jgi:hypothetical protein
VVLYDKETDGVVTVRFSDPEGARQCVRVGFQLLLLPVPRESANLFGELSIFLL